MDKLECVDFWRNNYNRTIDWSLFIS